MIKNFLLFCFLFSSTLVADGLGKEYYEIRDTSKKKKVFFDFINKMSIQENQKILNDREYIKKTYPKKTQRMLLIQKRYKLKANASLKEYLYHVDIIPNSMVMAQAALETAWGKSRFFKQAKNIFGQWTWKGKGLVPKHRKAGLTHKIKIFDTYEDSVRSYMVNINRGWAYKKVRDLRAKLRSQQKKISGYILANGLDKYSGKKGQYVTIIKKVINHNKLYKYDIY